MSMKEAAEKYNVPFETVRRHTRGITKSTRPGPKPFLGDRIGKELCEAAKEFNNISEGLTISNLRQFGAEICENSSLQPFKNIVPSRNWARRFQNRHGLTTRQPVNISVARLSMETAEVKNDLFSKVKSLYDELMPQGLTPAQIFNMDETGLCLVTKSGKVIAPKGEKTVRVKKGSERGENVTVIATGNASGSVILPPTIIFRGKSINENLLDGAPPGAVFASSPRSFIDSDLFEEWFHRFLISIPPARPVILFMDGHASHIQMKLIKLARLHNIHILLFPPHTTHLYQPMDKGVFGPLKKAFDCEARKLIRKNKLTALNRYHFCRVLTPAWMKAVTPANLVGGFEGSGLWPFNPSRVKLPCGEEVTLSQASHPLSEEDLSGEVQRTEDSENLLAETHTASSFNMETVLQDSATEPSGDETTVTEPTTSGSTIQKTSQEGSQPAQPPSLPPSTITSPQQSTTQSSEVSTVIQVIRSFLTPRQESDTSSKSKRVTTARMITGEEFLREMEEKEREKEEIEKAKKEKAEEKEKAKKKKAEEKEKARREKAEGKKKKVSAKSTKRSQTESLKENEPPANQKKATGLKTTEVLRQERKKRMDNESENSSEADDPDSCSDSSEEKELCGNCGKSFQDDFKGEAWIRCAACSDWYHNKCKNLGENYFEVDFKM